MVSLIHYMLRYILKMDIRFGEDSVEKMIDWIVDYAPSSDNSPTVLELVRFICSYI